MTLENPLVSPLYETLLFVGYDAAKGQTTATNSFDIIWSKFKTLHINSAEGKPLKYQLDLGEGVIPHDIFPLTHPQVHVLIT